MLVLADVVALAAAFLTIELLYGAGSGAGNTLHPVFEYALLLATVPGWIVIARLYSLYDQDEERTHHPTTDDLAGVFHLVTVCTWLFFAAVSVTGIAHPELTKVITVGYYGGPIFLFELTIGLWLLFKGVRQGTLTSST